MWKKSIRSEESMRNVSKWMMLRDFAMIPLFLFIFLFALAYAGLLLLVETLGVEV